MPLASSWLAKQKKERLLAGLKGTRRIVFPHSACGGRVESKRLHTRYEEHGISFPTNEGFQGSANRSGTLTSSYLIETLSKVSLSLPDCALQHTVWKTGTGLTLQASQAWYRCTSRVRALTHGNAAQPFLSFCASSIGSSEQSPKSFICDDQQSDTAVRRLRRVFLLVRFVSLFRHVQA